MKDSAEEAPVRQGKVLFVHPERVTIVGRDNLKGADHVLYDERATRPVDMDRVKNIRRYGVMNAVKVRKNGIHRDGPWEGKDVLEVVDGRGRTIDCREAYRQAEEAGEDPPLLKIEMLYGDEDLAVGVMVSANEYRDQDQVLNKARKASRLMSNGRNENDIAHIFRVSTNTIRNWLSLLQLSIKIQKAIERDLLSPSAALELKELSHEDQDKQLAKILAEVDSKVTAKEVRQSVQNKQKKSKSKGLKFNKHAARVLEASLRDPDAEEDWLEECPEEAAALIRFIATDDLDALDHWPSLRKKLESIESEKNKPKRRGKKKSK